MLEFSFVEFCGTKNKIRIVGDSFISIVLLNLQE